MTGKKKNEDECICVKEWVVLQVTNGDLTLNKGSTSQSRRSHVKKQ
jgi:hypothetical protein